MDNVKGKEVSESLSLPHQILGRRVKNVSASLLGFLVCPDSEVGSYALF
jgi:hypothetical protein